jgi:S-adenosyl-L-methionine hydrolase (adenosine-forming)
MQRGRSLYEFPVARALITLLTDFGTADGYAAEVKGVLLSGAPDAVVVDAGHDVAPQDVDGARLALARFWRRFPEGTIHLVIVDPGVGSTRAALAMQCEGRFLIGPDNGVLSPALLVPGARVVRLDVPTAAAATFHARDVFAPAAVRLAMGAAVDELGEAAGDPVIRRTPEPHRNPDGTLEGLVVTIDRFGNAVTNFLGVRGGIVRIAGRDVAVRRTYADAAPGEAVAVVGSSGLLEIALRDGNAAQVLHVTRGMAVRLSAR